jgi:LPXTG-site transpeptidase (sortase) family protein
VGSHKYNTVQQHTPSLDDGTIVYDRQHGTLSEIEQAVQEQSALGKTYMHRSSTWQRHLQIAGYTHRPLPEPIKRAESNEPPILRLLRTCRRLLVSAARLRHDKRRVHALLFGLTCSSAAVLILVLGFFNEVVIAPFIQPSRTVTDTPIIVDTATAVKDPAPRILIPKINVEIPVDYSLTTIDEATVETALDSGIVHYPSTVRPGQPGNAAFFGHSSNNIFNPGKYKFAFVLLHKLERKDVFYLPYEGKTFAYEVISSRVVKPTEVGVLGPVAGETATATLITCDPPGTSINRLVVVGRQIIPDPLSSPVQVSAATTPIAPDPAASLPANGKTLAGRIRDAIIP